MKQDEKKAVGRREFLRTMGAGAGVAAVAASPIAATSAAAQQKEDPKTKARYQETDHVKTFYRVNS